MTYTSEIGQYANTIRSDALQPSVSQENSRHQLRVMENLAKHKQDLDAARLNLKHLSAGVLISDFGKTEAGRELLKQEICSPGSKDSDLLITTLQGKAESKSAKLINELLAEKFGVANSSMINPNISPDEVRLQFRKEPRLFGFFHEFSGLLLLIKDYNADEMTKEEFTTQFWSTFGHNGPQKGFWDSFVGMINKGREAKGLTLHLGTPFSNKDGEFMYPNPNDEALLHTAYDRFDQGLEGLPKLAREMSVWADLKDVNTNLLGTNPVWTNDQLSELRNITDKAAETNPALGFIGKTIDSLKSVLTRFTDYIKERMDWTDESGVQTLSFKHPDGSTETLRKKADNYYEHNIAVTQPTSKQEFMDRNAAQFLSRVVRNFKEEDRYVQAV